MALEEKKYTKIYSINSSDSSYVDSKQLAEMQSDFETNDYIEDPAQFKTLGPVLFQLQKMQDELDALRDKILVNINKSTFPFTGLKGESGTSEMTSIEHTYDEKEKSHFIIFTVTIPDGKKTQTGVATLELKI